MKTPRFSSLTALTLVALVVVVVGTALPALAEEETSHAVPNVSGAFLTEMPVTPADQQVAEEETSQAAPDMSGAFLTVLALLEAEIPMTPADKPGAASHYAPGICMNSCQPCFTNADCTLFPGGDRCLALPYCP